MADRREFPSSVYSQRAQLQPGSGRCTYARACFSGKIQDRAFCRSSAMLSLRCTRCNSDSGMRCLSSRARPSAAPPPLSDRRSVATHNIACVRALVKRGRVTFRKADFSGRIRSGGCRSPEVSWWEGHFPPGIDGGCHQQNTAALHRVYLGRRPLSIETAGRDWF